MGLFRVTFVKKTGSGQVTELWLHKRNNLRPIFHRNLFFGQLQELNLLPLTGMKTLIVLEVRRLSHLTFDIVSWILKNHPRALASVDPSIPRAVKLTFLDVLRFWCRICGLFSNEHVYKASWSLPMPISVIRTVFPLAIFCEHVLFSVITWCFQNDSYIEVQTKKK